MKPHHTPLRIRGGVAFILGLTLMASFFTYNILLGTVNVGRLLQVITTTEEHSDVIFDIDSHLVWSTKCQIPNVSPFHESIIKLIDPVDPIECTKKPLLTYTTMSPEHVPTLSINTSALSHYTKHPNNITCCYSVITRVNTPDGKEYNKTADDYYNVSKCLNFSKEIKLRSEEEYVLVKCNDETEKINKTEIYKNVHAVVQVKDDVRKKIERSVSEDQKESLSVLVFGLDSISRLNFLRTMPKTSDYLRRSGWLELQGYNKIGENTLPNLSAIFMGLNEEQLKKECWESAENKFDDCPLIWKNFSALNYVTAYLEDTPTQSTFNYQKTGFVKPPTDYYMRHMLLAAEQLLPTKIRNYLKVCLGPTQTTEHLLQYVTDFVTVFRRALYFVVTWINNFSHSHTGGPAVMDEKILKFFEKLEGTGALNTTIMIFLSDHGMRWGEIRNTPVGWLEERLPFIYFWVPPWFREKHPEAYNNLVSNRNRLTSPYDVHVTLKDILQRSSHVTNSIAGCPGCNKCVSLFSEVPAERGCEDAGVIPHWCTCTKYRAVPTSEPIVQEIALFVVSEINSKIKKLTNGTDVCAGLRFNHVIQTKRQVATNHDDYVVVLDTLPGGAKFEATVGRIWNSPEKTGNFKLRGSVSRINSYGNTTECVDGAELKSYCHCV